MTFVLLVAIAAALLLILLLELALRVIFGFGAPLLYVPDEDIGYLLAPNQTTRRFGNQIAINRYSMRSPPIQPQRSPSTLRLLMLGDSILNGGWWTDQAETISALLQRQLQNTIALANPPPEEPTHHQTGTVGPLATSGAFEQVEVLNASANSWGPRNELAYLETFGSFEAQAIILIINTDDLFSAAPTAAGVGRDRSYPNRLPPFALAEIVSRYLLPRLPGYQDSDWPSPQPESGDPVDYNLDAIQQLSHLAQQVKAHFLLAMTPLLREIGNPGPRDYERRARQQLNQWVQTAAIPYIDFLPRFNQSEQPGALYRDHIHLSAQGNRQVSQAIFDAIRFQVLEVRG